MSTTTQLLQYVTSRYGIPSEPPPAPVNPTNLSATAASPNQVNLSWTDTNAGKYGYEVWRDDSVTPPQGVIFHDDFSTDRTADYFEYDNAGGNFVRVAGAGKDGGYAMRARFGQGTTSAGSLKLAFGKTPDPYMRPVDLGTYKYRELYWRVVVRCEAGWSGGGGDKLSRAIVFANSDWAEAAIAHIWSGGTGNNYIVADPASGTDTAGNLQTRFYNDFERLRWIGATTGTNPLFSDPGKWYEIESHVKLNDLGKSNGVFEFWIDGVLQGRREDLNWLGAYDAYGINALFVENYWNSGSPKQQDRFFDSITVSTERIGTDQPVVPVAPTNFVAIPGGPYAVALTWDDTNLGSQRYEVRRGGTLIATTARGAVFYSDSGLTPDTLYNYEVRTEGMASGPTASAKTATVQPDDPKGPQPQAGDRILLDTRTTLQAATTSAQAKALFNWVSDEFSFVTDVDGRGTKAMRADYYARPGQCWDAGAALGKDFSTPYPKEVYYQYKILLGRTPTGGGVGEIGRFQITNATCGNAGAKRFLTNRDVPDRGALGRTDFIWPGGAPAEPWLVTDSGGLSQKQNRNMSGGIYLPQDHVGEVMTWTIYYKAESAAGAGNGIARLWIDDTLLIETTNAGFGHQAFIGCHFPATFRAPQYDQSEYYWDIVLWEPK